MTVPNIEAIAEQLQAGLAHSGAAYANALGDHWPADTVHVSHEPPLPQDGPMTRAQMLTERTRIDTAFRTLMPDFHYDNLYTRVIGEVIYLFCDQNGTLASGEKISSPLITRAYLRDGKFDRIVLGIDSEKNAPLLKAFMALAAKS